MCPAPTPISGASAAARITPVPKPPMPLMTAAPSASTATTASMGASSSNLGARHRARAPAGVDRDVSERRFSYLDHRRRVGRALRVHLDCHRDRGVADAHHVGVEREHVADLHRLLENKLL